MLPTLKKLLVFYLFKTLLIPRPLSLSGTFIGHFDVLGGGRDSSSSGKRWSTSGEHGQRRAVARAGHTNRTVRTAAEIDR